MSSCSQAATRFQPSCLRPTIIIFQTSPIHWAEQVSQSSPLDIQSSAHLNSTGQSSRFCNLYKKFNSQLYNINVRKIANIILWRFCNGEKVIEFLDKSDQGNYLWISHYFIYSIFSQFLYTREDLVLIKYEWTFRQKDGIVHFNNICYFEEGIVFQNKNTHQQ